MRMAQGLENLNLPIQVLLQLLVESDYIDGLDCDDLP